MGSEQFLGRQLSEQATALALLVDKMQQMIITQELSIPKYTIISNNLKETKIFGTKTSGLCVQGIGYEFTIYLNGKIKIRYNGYNNYSNSQSIKLLKNGVEYTTLVMATKTSGENIVEIEVKENDVIKIYSSLSDGSYNNNLFLNELYLYYDLISKPSTSI